MKKNLTSLLLVAFMIVASAFLSYAAFPVASQKATVVTTASTTSTALQEVMQQQQEEYASNAPTTQAPAAPTRRQEPSSGFDTLYRCRWHRYPSLLPWIYLARNCSAAYAGRMWHLVSD